MKLCKCKRIEEYWDAIGTPKQGYFSRSTLLMFLILGAIPIFGQLLLITVLIYAPLRARCDDRVTEQYRLSYIERLIREDQKLLQKPKK